MNRALALLRHLLLLVAAGLSGLAATTHAQNYPPRPEGPVYDGANILSVGTKAQLDQQLRAYNAQTGRAIVVATVPSLGGASIETYATTLFTDKWGIGGAKRDAGLLLLIAPTERKMRIEVGYGLHGYFGGIMAGRVINDVIAPRFKEGSFDAGVTNGVQAILAHLDKSPADAAAIEEAAQAAEAQKSRSDGGLPVGALIWIGVILVFFVLPALRRGRRRSYRSSGTGPWGNRGLGDTARDIILWEVGSAVARGLIDSGRGGGGGDWRGGGGFGGGGFGGFGGGSSGGGGASGGW